MIFNCCVELKEGKRTEEVGEVMTTRKVVHSNVGKPTQMRIIGGMVSEVAKDWNMNFELGQLEDVDRRASCRERV